MPVRQCLQYKTDQQTDLRRLEKLNILFFALMSKGEVTGEHVMTLPATHM
jgi:hypothetical protein